MISILYVDDEPGLLEIGKLFLEQTGDFRVDTAESGEEALARIEKNQYDAIVSDYQMPGMDGLSLLKKIRQTSGDLPFILFTGRGREEVVIEAVNNGVDFYLQKGGDPKAQFAELMHKLRQAVSRKEAERELQESEKRLTDIINFLPDATFAIDRKGRVIAWNRAIEDLTGVPAESMLGRGEHEYAIPFYGTRRPILIDMIFEPEERLRQYYSGIRREKETLIAETDLPRPRGMVLTLMGKASPLFDRQGNVAGAIESIRDITARKQEEDELKGAYDALRTTEEELRKQCGNLEKSEQVLRDSEEKYRTLVENSQDIVYIYRDDHILVINRRGPEVLGYSEEELRSMPIWDLLHPEDRQWVYQRGVARFGGANLPPQYSARILTKSGRVIPMELAAMVVTYQGERAIMGIAHDITEREEYFAAMARKNKTLAAINQIIIAANLSRDTKVILEKGLAATCELAGFESGGIYLQTGPEETAMLACTRNMDAYLISSAMTAGIGAEPLGSMVGNGEMPVTNAPEILFPAALRNRGFRSFAGIPISAEQTVMGVLCLFSSRNLTISPDDRDALLAIGKEMGSAITRVRMETALQESEEHYRTLVETTGTGFVIIDSEGRVADANPEYVRLSGHHTLQEILGRRITEWTAPWDYERNEEAVRICLENGSIRNFDVDYCDAAGHVIPVEINATVVRNRGSVQIITLCRDISGRRKADASLRASEATLASIFRAAPVGIGVISDGIIRQVNDRFCRMTGYSCAELPEKSLGILYPDADTGERAWPEIHRQVQEQGTCTLETSWVKQDGSFRDVLFCAAPLDPAKPESDLMFTVQDITDQKAAQAGLREAYERLSATEKELRTNYDALAAATTAVRLREEQIREITANVPGVVFQFLASPDGQITEIFLCEDAMEEFTGTVSLDQFREGIHPEDREGFLQSRNVATGSGEPWHCEGRFIRSSGEQVWFQISANPTITPRGSLYTGILLDITARKKTGEALRRTENLYGALADEAQDLIFVINRDDTVAYVNRFATATIGRSREDVIGRPVTILFPGPDGESQRQDLKSVFASGEALRTENRIAMPSGKYWLNTHLIPLRDAGGTVTAVLGISRDITALKETGEALRRSEMQYRSIIENMQDMIYRTGTDGKLIMISPAGARMAGYDSPEEMIGIDVAQEIYADPEQRKRFLIALSRRGSVTGYPLVLKTRTGREFHATANSHYYRDADGKIAGIEGIIHDVSDLRQAEAALREANRKLNLLNSITRHDVANQLTVLLGYSQLAMLKNTDPVTADFLGKIDAVASTISRQIEFSKEYQELGVQAPGWFVLDAILTRTRPREILFSTSCTGVEIFADPMLEKVFANLFGNAIMHGERVTRIAVRCEPDGENLLITVEDNGVGIPLDEKQNIFKKGYGKHTGFGLFLAREILAITGITIHETGRHGTGARFEITVPKSGFRHTSGTS